MSSGGRLNPESLSAHAAGVEDSPSEPVEEGRGDWGYRGLGGGYLQALEWTGGQSSDIGWLGGWRSSR